MGENDQRPFDHDWGPLIDDQDFEESKSNIFHHHHNSQLLLDHNDDNHHMTNDFMDLESNNNNSSPEMELLFRGRSIAERRAAKFGFDASRMNNVDHHQIRGNICNTSPPISSSSPSGSSSFLTIPPGISPAALLDSPVMLPNSQPSPTTGTFPRASCSNRESLTGYPAGSDRSKAKDTTIDAFAKFRHPAAHPTSQIPRTPSVENQAPTIISKSVGESRKEVSAKAVNISVTNASEIDVKPCNIDNHMIENQIPRHRERIKMEAGSSHHQIMGGDQDAKGAAISNAGGLTRNAEDGYCWRKYGQKHVKGSEYPRSYYKCNHPNCLVKKKVERSHDGEITEIIYKGAHNHPKPQPRLNLGRQTPGELLVTNDQGISDSWRFDNNNQVRTNNKDFRVDNSDWKGYGSLKRSSSNNLNEVFSNDPIGNGSQGKTGLSAENTEVGSINPNNEGEYEDGAAQGCTSPGDDADGDESEPKRRKKEIFSAEAYLPSRSTREPRIILQIESEIDVLDDGYRWRKYGQKVVKGNPNPRSYYKCTSAGCPVRKHVERASEDIKSVITTYEGKHNHEVPTAKTNGPSSSNLGNSPPNVSDPHSILTLPRNHPLINVVPNQEMQVQDLPPLHYPNHHDFSQPDLVGDLVSDMKLGGGTSSIYQIKFPTLQSPPMPYNPFVMTSNGSDPVMLDFPMAVPMSGSVQSSIANINHSRMSGSVQASIANQQTKESDLRFFKPKEEQNDDDPNAKSSTGFGNANGNFPP